MAIIQKIETSLAPAAIGPYSQAMVVNGMVYTSGMIPVDPATGNVTGRDIETQAAQVMKNLEALLTAAGSDFAHVVKTTCFLDNMADFAKFNEIYAASFTSCPARSCVEAAQLPKGVLVEVEVIAVQNVLGYE